MTGGYLRIELIPSSQKCPWDCADTPTKAEGGGVGGGLSYSCSTQSRLVNGFQAFWEIEPWDSSRWGYEAEPWQVNYFLLAIHMQIHESNIPIAPLGIGFSKPGAVGGLHAFGDGFLPFRCRQILLHLLLIEE